MKKPFYFLIFFAIFIISLILFLGSGSEHAFKSATIAYKKKDYETAIFLYKSLAEKGDSEAQFMLAKMLHSGSGTEKDDTQALIWLEKSASQNNLKAIQLLNEIKPKPTETHSNPAK